ncbi:hypothetical protein GP486_007592 [Trichoglossum hirsutum]|uniref:RCC1-like domain-containing protein n=1 Tax=Trichoglossum hirsutum TaxID=265104 RepID=A0A9P8IBF9_9PEZI|nr:hypothetical protein GP486_007592 [Trichoglossum hirsutum]
MPPKKTANVAETTGRRSARAKTTTKPATKPSAPASKKTVSNGKGKNAQPSVASVPATKRKVTHEDSSSRPLKQIKVAEDATKASARTKATGTKESATKKPATKVAEKKTTQTKATPAKAADTKKVATKAVTKATAKSTTKTVPVNDAKPVRGKRKATDEEEGVSPRPTKKASISEPPKVKAPHPVKIARRGPRSFVGKAPTTRLNVYVFGEGSSGELGLGSAKTAVDVKRPRLNPNLAAGTVGVVQIAAGGMHAVALTDDNKILTWGVNDLGAVGRDTEWEGGLKDIDDDSDDSSDEDSGMNPKESTPAEVPGQYFEENTKFVQVAAGDSATFAVTEEGYVYGWGTFRNNEGVLGFSQDSHIQYMPTHVAGLKRIKSIAMGNNHALALDNKGNVFAWGSGQQNQLGRRLVERTAKGGLVPREFGLPKNKIKFVACGSYHSFAIDDKGRVWAWGANSYCETGIPQGLGDNNSVVAKPTIVESLSDYRIKYITGGDHHSLAVTDDGELLVWGRLDGFQIGIKVEDIPKDHITFDDKDVPRILHKPLKIKGLKVSMVAAGSDTSIAITTDGKAYSWGFSSNYQTGQGTDDDVEVATMIDNTAVRGKKLTWAGCGGQYSMLASPAEDTVMVNGV